MEPKMNRKNFSQNHHICFLFGIRRSCLYLDKIGKSGSQKDVFLEIFFLSSLSLGFSHFKYENEGHELMSFY